MPQSRVGEVLERDGGGGGAMVPVETIPGLVRAVIRLRSGVTIVKCMYVLLWMTNIPGFG